MKPIVHAFVHLATALLLIASCGIASAASIRVPQDQPTIPAAVAAAADGDIILIAPGTYPAVDVTSRTLTLRGQNESTTDTAAIYRLNAADSNLTLEWIRIDRSVVARRGELTMRHSVCDTVDATLRSGTFESVRPPTYHLIFHLDGQDPQATCRLSETSVGYAQVKNFAAVEVTACYDYGTFSLINIPRLRISDSVLGPLWFSSISDGVVLGSSMLGSGGYAGGCWWQCIACGCMGESPQDGSPAALVQDQSRILFDRCTLHGGNGPGPPDNQCTWGGCWQTAFPGCAGGALYVASASIVTVRPNCTLTAGTSSLCPTPPLLSGNGVVEFADGSEGWVFK